MFYNSQNNKFLPNLPPLDGGSTSIDTDSCFLEDTFSRNLQTPKNSIKSEKINQDNSPYSGTSSSVGSSTNYLNFQNQTMNNSDYLFYQELPYTIPWNLKGGPQKPENNHQIDHVAGSLFS